MCVWARTGCFDGPSRAAAGAGRYQGQLVGRLHDGVLYVLYDMFHGITVIQHVSMGFPVLLSHSGDKQSLSAVTVGIARKSSSNIALCLAGQIVPALHSTSSSKPSDLRRGIDTNLNLSLPTSSPFYHTYTHPACSAGTHPESPLRPMPRPRLLLGPARARVRVRTWVRPGPAVLFC